VSTNLARISVSAREHPDQVFTSLYHHIADIDHLRACYRLLKGNKAVGVDEVTKSMYAEDLEANLQDLSARLKRMGYRPHPKRRIYIPKPGSEQGRPLGISSFEDKIVELATQRVLEPLFEPLFDDCSYGYRPQRSPHQCLDALGRTLQHKRVNILVEADIRGFFDAVNHEWLLKFLRQRIGDERVIRLISRMLKAGIMEDGLVQVAEVGTPQGSILSPLLSNVYLHYVLDLWFQRRIRRRCRGEAYLFRCYCSAWGSSLSREE
jgi:RNA-directed DNA polymerase